MQEQADSPVQHTAVPGPIRSLPLGSSRVVSLPAVSHRRFVALMSGFAPWVGPLSTNSSTRMRPMHLQLSQQSLANVSLEWLMRAHFESSCQGLEVSGAKRKAGSRCRRGWAGSEIGYAHRRGR